VTYLGQTPRPGSLLKEKREKRKRNKTPAEKRPGHPKHLEKIRQLPCCLCGSPPRNDPHHLKRDIAKRGMAMRAPDDMTVPLCRSCHDDVERAGTRNEPRWFLSLAAGLWASRHSLAAMQKVLETHRGLPVGG